MFSGAKVLVAGGAGFAGVNLINRLLSLGAKVRATIHRKDPVILDERIEYVRCDLTKMEDCRKVVSDMDYVFLCAANTSIPIRLIDTTKAETILGFKVKTGLREGIRKTIEWYRKTPQ